MIRSRGILSSILSGLMSRGIGYHHIIMFLIPISVIFLSILLAGCTDTRLSNVYLLSLSYHNGSSSSTRRDLTQVNPNISATFTDLVGSSDTASLEIRAGYMGICMRQSAGPWDCSTSAERHAGAIRETKSAAGDPLNLIWTAKNFMNQIVFSGLMWAQSPFPICDCNC